MTTKNSPPMVGRPANSSGHYGNMCSCQGFAQILRICSPPASRSIEIAHRLGVARSTVGYHVSELREAESARPDASVATRPKAPAHVTRAEVRRLLETGHSRAAVARLLGLRRSTDLSRA